MRPREYPTIEACETDLCPRCLQMAKSFQRYITGERQYAEEERLRDPNLSTPERIKAAYARHGRKFDWDRSGNYMRLAYQPPMKCPSYKDMDKFVNEAVAYEAFDFTREVIRNKDFTVTRISCQGITVEETITS